MAKQSDKKSQPVIVSEEENNEDNALILIGLNDVKPRYIGANEEESE